MGDIKGYWQKCVSMGNIKVHCYSVFLWAISRGSAYSVFLWTISRGTGNSVFLWAISRGTGKSKWDMCWSHKMKVYIWQKIGILFMIICNFKQTLWLNIIWVYNQNSCHVFSIYSIQLKPKTYMCFQSWRQFVFDWTFVKKYSPTCNSMGGNRYICKSGWNRCYWLRLYHRRKVNI